MRVRLSLTSSPSTMARQMGAELCITARTYQFRQPTQAPRRPLPAPKRSQSQLGKSRNTCRNHFWQSHFWLGHFHPQPSRVPSPWLRRHYVEPERKGVEQTEEVVEGLLPAINLDLARRNRFLYRDLLELNPSKVSLLSVR